jgi:chemotaxis protein methyltransferase CheR
MTTETAWADSREFSFNQRDFRFLVELVHKRTGIVLADHKRDMVYSRLARRLRALRLSRFTDYCDLLQGDDGEEEMSNLVNAITTNLTSFFREPHHFDHLHDEVLMPMFKKPSANKRIRIWSAGCSSGMEPYSIALTLANADKNWTKWDTKILATDIDTNMLQRGKKGEYSAEQLEHIPPAYHSMVSQNKANSSIQMHDSLRQSIIFNYLNLQESWPMKGPFDVIFCRNVVIYFDKDTQKILFNRMADLLKPNGWLYIGHSENLFKVCDRFNLTGRTIYRKAS